MKSNRVPSQKLTSLAVNDAIAMQAGFLALLVIYGAWVALLTFTFAVVAFFSSVLRGLWEIRRIRTSTKAMKIMREGRLNGQERRENEVS